MCFQLPWKTFLLYFKSKTSLAFLRKIRYHIILKLAFCLKIALQTMFFTLRTLMDKYVRYHKEKVYACFVDSFRKAFDSVWREGLFYKLLKTNIEVNLYSLMKSLYCYSTCSIKIGENKTQPSSYSRGVRQGCILSELQPLFYCLTILCINNLETNRSYKRKVNLKNLKFFKKSIERFKNYSLI